jgi:hypothetical protein
MYTGKSTTSIGMVYCPYIPSAITKVFNGKRDSSYARVYHYKTNNVVGYSEVNVVAADRIAEDPIGVVVKKNIATSEHWVKIAKRWVPSLVARDPITVNDLNFEFVLFIDISKEEYETDLAFGLWNKLPCTTRPVRTWFKKNYNRIMQWNLTAACITVVGTFQWLRMSSATGDIWYIIGLLMGVHALASMLWLVYDIHKKQHGNK